MAGLWDCRKVRKNLDGTDVWRMKHVPSQTNSTRIIAPLPSSQFSQKSQRWVEQVSKMANARHPLWNHAPSRWLDGSTSHVEQASVSKPREKSWFHVGSTLLALSLQSFSPQYVSNPYQDRASAGYPTERLSSSTISYHFITPYSPRSANTGFPKPSLFANRSSTASLFT